MIRWTEIYSGWGGGKTERKSSTRGKLHREERSSDESERRINFRRRRLLIELPSGISFWRVLLPLSHSYNGNGCCSTNYINCPPLMTPLTTTIQLLRFRLISLPAPIKDDDDDAGRSNKEMRWDDNFMTTSFSYKWSGSLALPTNHKAVYSPIWEWWILFEISVVVCPSKWSQLLLIQPERGEGESSSSPSFISLPTTTLMTAAVMFTN